MQSVEKKPDCYVGLDLGTSGCRAVAIDADRNILAQARTPLPPSRHPEPGTSEQTPQDWWLAVCQTLRKLTADLTGNIRALSIDGTSSTLLLCEHDGTPLTPALMYDDRRARDQAQRLARAAPADSPALGPGSALAKLLYLQTLASADKAAHAMHQADWISGKLSGQFGRADENNVLKLGYDPVGRKWPEWLNSLDFPTHLLPRVHPVGTPLGGIAYQVAKGLGLAEDVLLVAGTTDSNAAVLAAGLDRRGDAVTSLGSTLVIKVFSDRPLSSSRYGIYSHRIADGWLTGGASNTGGAVLRQFFTDREIIRLSSQLNPAKPLNLGYYPLPAVGERFPRSAPDMQPKLHPRPKSRQDFLQALLEGIADIEAEGYARLAQLGAPFPRRVFSSGGGAVNQAWRQIRERRLGVPVLRATQTEAAFGTALLARSALLGPMSTDSRR
jgi:sugar (pentulose or hexulose) kinase